MIKKITNIDVISGVSSPLLPLIYGDFYYHYNDNDGVYIQYVNDKASVLLSLKNNSCNVIKLCDCVDYNELESFFLFSGATSVVSDMPFNSKNEKEANLLKIGKVRFQEAPDVFSLSRDSLSEEYHGVYNLISENKGANFPEWYLYFAKKINAGLSAGVYIKIDNAFASSAIAPVIFNDIALVAGVFTKDEYRNFGFASKCVKALLNEINNLNISNTYLWCDDDKLLFYKNIGFSQVGKVYIREEI